MNDNLPRICLTEERAHTSAKVISFPNTDVYIYWRRRKKDYILFENKKTLHGRLFIAHYKQGILQTI